MDAKELRLITDAAIKSRKLNRPNELKNELLKRMAELASRGIDHIEFCFLYDESEIVNEVIRLLKLEGFRCTTPRSGDARFEW